MSVTFTAWSLLGTTFVMGYYVLYCCEDCLPPSTPPAPVLPDQVMGTEGEINKLDCKPEILAMFLPIHSKHTPYTHIIVLLATTVQLTS